jgi:hypothetical protein
MFRIATGSLLVFYERYRVVDTKHISPFPLYFCQMPARFFWTEVATSRKPRSAILTRLRANQPQEPFSIDGASWECDEFKKAEENAEELPVRRKIPLIDTSASVRYEDCKDYS